MRITTGYIREKYNIDNEAIDVPYRKPLGQIYFDFNRTPLSEVVSIIEEQLKEFPKDAYIEADDFHSFTEYEIFIETTRKEKPEETIDRLKKMEKDSLKKEKAIEDARKLLGLTTKEK